MDTGAAAAAADTRICCSCSNVNLVGGIVSRIGLVKANNNMQRSCKTAAITAQLLGWQ